MDNNSNYGKSILVCILVILTFITPFIFTRPAIHSSVNFTDTGQIGDTIGGITTPFIGLINIFILWITLHEQRRLNNLLRFESSLWRIGGDNNHYKDNWNEQISEMNILLRNHFGTIDKSLTMSQLCCLLNYYWNLIDANELRTNIEWESYFKVHKKRLIYINKHSDKLLRHKDEQFYVDIVLSELPELTKLVFYSYIINFAYNDKQSQWLLTYIASDLASIMNITHKSCKYKFLEYNSQTEDYGYNYVDLKFEHYSKTISRLNIR